MLAGSTRSLATVLEKTDEVLSSGADGEKLGDDLFAFARLLDHEHALRRGLTEPAVGAEAKAKLLRAVAGKQIGEAALDVVEVAVGHRWSRSRDLADVLEQASVAALVAKADDKGKLDELEDNLFRFARIVEANDGLREVLSDQDKPWEGKRALVSTLLKGKVDPMTKKLVGQAVATRHRSLSGVLATYQRVAAKRRDSLVATVWVAAPLDDDHKTRLAEALASHYEREVHLNVIIDSDLLGGVRVAVGDEVIDSTVEGRLRLAQRALER